MPTATLTSKGQLTVPKEIRDQLGLKPGDRLSFEIRESGSVVMEPETVDFRGLTGILEYEGEPATLEEIQDAMEQGALGE